MYLNIDLVYRRWSRFQDETYAVLYIEVKPSKEWQFCCEIVFPVGSELEKKNW